MQACFVYMTAGSVEEAREIGRALLEARLASCINIIDSMQSLYWWEEQVREDREVVFIAKTVSSLVPDLVELVKSRHSYECPCVVSLPITGGNQDFLDWIIQQTQS
ncbi:MAG: divalent-cation tolerance protein CutA [Deltaproteobacteria bacterium]|nr:divalent-cation tolerance protein CutA [Deltaproteobacteria bacterium]